jgi:uncharacterized protein (TIGR02453 family)
MGGLCATIREHVQEAAMAGSAAIFTPEIFRFFRELSRHNEKPWMDANRERYQEHVVAPFRALLEALAPAALALDSSIDISGRTGSNFSRINRDIRFRPDTPPYHTHMYLTFSGHGDSGRNAGQLYVGISADSATAGFRIYGGSRNEGKLSKVAAPRAMKNAAWLRRQKQRLGRKYESYWYAIEKGEWTKKDGWPLAPEDWKKIGGWVVRRAMKPAEALRSQFVSEATRVFRDLYALYAFTSQPNWKP